MATSVALPFEAFAKRQAITDAVINIVLAGGSNYLLSRHLGEVPLTRAFGNNAPSLFGALIATSVLMSIFLTLIVFAITVAQRKSGKVMPPLSADTQGRGTVFRLAFLHLLITLPPVIGLNLLAATVGQGVTLPPLVFALITAAIAAVAAHYMSLNTTRATLKLG